MQNNSNLTPIDRNQQQSNANQTKIRRGKTWAKAFRCFFSKFGHSSEFRVFSNFSLENIENLVLNLRPGSVD